MTLDVDQFWRQMQDENDKRLDRWRDPDNRDVVVYRTGPDEILVLNEKVPWLPTRVERDQKAGALYVRAVAETYWGEHPELQPWEEAQPGEVWAVTTDGASGNAWTLEHGAFIFDDQTSVQATEITDAHRLFPPTGGGE